MWEEMKVTALLDLKETLAAPLLAKAVYPWEALPWLREFIQELGPTLSKEEYEERGEGIWAARSAQIAPSAYLGSPVIIGPNAEIRHCAFIRGGALIGEGVVVGNSTELKNVILFNGAQVPHYNYVGDSILGYKAHMGAGAITSNVKSDKTPVTVRMGEERLETGFRKMGAVLGDFAEIGCNSVLNPGTVIGRDARVYPLSMVRGFVPENSIYKRRGEVVMRS